MSTDPKVWTALITGGLAFLGTIIGLIVSVYTSKRLEILKAELSERGNRIQAKRDYEYEALKRIYAHYEAIRFQLIEACENTSKLLLELGYRYKVIEEIPKGSLPGGNYLQIATVYHLLLPCVYFQVLKHKLTLVDLDIICSIHLQYDITRSIYLVFTHDSEIARLAGLKYTPYVKGWRELREKDPHQYRR